MKHGLFKYAHHSKSIVKEPVSFLIFIYSNSLLINALTVADLRGVMAFGLDNSTLTWAASWGIVLFWAGFWLVHILGNTYG